MTTAANLIDNSRCPGSISFIGITKGAEELDIFSVFEKFLFWGKYEPAQHLSMLSINKQAHQNIKINSNCQNRHFSPAKAVK